MDAGGNAAALAVLDWWRQSGVDALIDEQPRNWLAGSRAAPTALEAASSEALPTSLAAVRDLLASLPHDGEPAILPAGDAAAGLMLITAMPTAFDTPHSGLFAGNEGRLLDAMLGAIGRDRASIYLASLAPFRPAGGKIEAQDLPRLLRIARRHIALAAPKAVLLLGDAAAGALLGLPLPAARGRTHRLALDEITVNVVVTFSPQMLLERAASKADCWADLRRLLEELNQ